jgi:hypothetical protein
MITSIPQLQSRTPSAYVPPSIWENSIQIHTKQQAKYNSLLNLYLFVSIFFALFLATVNVRVLTLRRGCLRWGAIRSATKSWCLHHSCFVCTVVQLNTESRGTGYFSTQGKQCNTRAISNPVLAPYSDKTVCPSLTVCSCTLPLWHYFPYIQYGFFALTWSNNIPLSFNAVFCTFVLPC